MAANPNIQQLTFTVGIDKQAINNEVGPLILSTKKPYRMRRNKQPSTIARKLNIGQRETYANHGNRGVLGRLSVEILFMIFERVDVRTFVRMKRVCKSVKMVAEKSTAQKMLEYISVAEPKSLSLFMRSGLGYFYPTSILNVFFEKTCFLCHGHGDGIFLPTMTRICLSCSENSPETSCICMTTATDKYSLTVNQIAEAHIPLIISAIPSGNLKLLPENMVRNYALKIHGSMTDIELAFEKNKQVKMTRYDILHAKWEAESGSFDNWAESVETEWGTQRGTWPENFYSYYMLERERLKKKPKVPRQTFEVSDTHTAGREAGTTKYLMRKAKVIDRYTGTSERFCYCLGCRRNVLPAQYLAIGAGGLPEDVQAAQQPYLIAHGDLFQHQQTCTHVAVMRHEHQQRLVMAVRRAIEREQLEAISVGMKLSQEGLL